VNYSTLVYVYNCKINTPTVVVRWYSIVRTRNAVRESLLFVNNSRKSVVAARERKPTVKYYLSRPRRPGVPGTKDRRRRQSVKGSFNSAGPSSTRAGNKPIQICRLNIYSIAAPAHVSVRRLIRVWAHGQLSNRTAQPAAGARVPYEKIFFFLILIIGVFLI